MASTTLIVYVHGALSTKNSWNYIRQKLADKTPVGATLNGQPIVDSKPREEFIHYDLGKELSEDIVAKMVPAIKGWAVGMKKVVLVAHSFGGVLSVDAIYQLTEFFKEQKIKVKLISLSSPYSGSEMASMLRLFRPSSKFFKNIGTNTDFIRGLKSRPLPCKAHIFVTTEGGAEWMPQANDGVVSVASQKFFENDPSATLQEVKANHFEILLSDAVVNQLIKDAK